MPRQAVKLTIVMLTTVMAVGLGVGSARAGYVFTNQFGSRGSGNGQLFQPFGVATDASGNVFVVDEGNERVEEFSNTGTFIRTFGSLGSGNGQFRGPLGVATDASGNVYVADFTRFKVQEFSNTGTFLRAFGLSDNPGFLAIDPIGNVYVSGIGDLTPDRQLEVFSNTGTLLRAFSRSDFSSPSGPSGVATDTSGNVFVADPGNNRVVEFSNTGTFLRAFGSQGSGPGQFNAPSGVATDAVGNVFVVDTGNNRVEEFDNTGVFITAFGSQGAGPGQFDGPIGLATDAGGNVFVTDNNNRVQVFSPTAAAVPEPGTLGLAATGVVVALAAYARRRRGSRLAG